MGKFINTERTQIINNLVEGFKDKLKNPYYVFNDKPVTISTYYNKNQLQSSLDDGTGLEYSPLGNESPTKFNKIYNMYLYGMEKIQVDLENGDWGIESNSIEGEVIILPNTIIPCVGDYFTIDYLKDKVLFKIISITNDTVDNGSNFYKLSYKLDQVTDEIVNTQVVDEFTMMVENEGTNFKTIIRNNDYKFIEIAEDILDTLKEYYRELFYSSRVQTFILNYNYKYFYDPYMIEFISRNDLINTRENYIFIHQQLYLPGTFVLDYDKTFFRYLELPDKKDIDKVHIYSQGKYINDIFSIMNDRPEDYYKIEYINKIEGMDQQLYTLNNFDMDLISRIKDNNLYDTSDSNLIYRNIIIKFLNNIDVIADDISTLNDIEYNQSITLFYEIPIIIFILEKIIKKLIV